MKIDWFKKRKHEYPDKNQVIEWIVEYYPEEDQPKRVLQTLLDSKVIISYSADYYYLNYDIRTIYHPTERDKNGRRIILLNNTIWQYPPELF